MNNDLSMLRPFDLEAAKSGEPICTRDGRSARFIAYVPELDAGCLVLAVIQGYGSVHYCYKSGNLASQDYGGHPDDLVMAPLCWIEGRPVYPGDRVWCRLYNEWVIACESRHPNNLVADGHEKGLDLDVRDLTWTPPTVKREGWINISPRDFNDLSWVDSINGLVSQSYTSKKNADKYASPNRVACIRIEWEELAGEKE